MVICRDFFLLNMRFFFNLSRGKRLIDRKSSDEKYKINVRIGSITTECFFKIFTEINQNKLKHL